MMKLSTLVRMDRSAKRVAEIVGVLGKYGLADWLSHLDYDWLQRYLQGGRIEEMRDLTTPERIRLAMTELGTSFIKVGQILSTRPDLVGAELTTELSKLQANTPADDYEQVAEMIYAELGSRPEELFAEFEQQAMASASIGQVHRAVLKTGEIVVVKVIHQGIEDAVRQDMDILSGLAELAEKNSLQLRNYQPVANAKYFERTLLREMDFAYERRHLESFAKNFENEADVHFPKVYGEFCSQRVLVMELLEGISVSDEKAMVASGADLEAFAQRGADMYLDMIFRDGFYHADPHPGNLMLLEGGVLGVLDAGMVGRIDTDLREGIEDMLLAAVEGDSGELADQVMRIGQTPPELDRDELRAEIGDFLADYVGQSINDFDTAGAMSRLLEAIRSFHIVMPSSFALLMKTLVTLDGTAKLLSPNFNLAAMIKPYYKKAIKRRLTPKRLLSEVHRSYRDWKRLADALPRDLTDILARIRKGTFEVQMEHRRLEGTVDRLVNGLLTAALFVGSAMMWSTAAPPTVWGVSVFGATGCLLAFWMGFWLIRAIRKSNK
ncbi:MAG: AarF/ABC1/UbiB kinase family protein [Verrucomicrobiota bacterium]